MGGRWRGWVGIGAGGCDETVDVAVFAVLFPLL